MKEYIDVVERDSHGTEVGRFQFWGRMTIELDGGGSVTICAPGFYSDSRSMESLGKKCAEEEEGHAK